MPRRRAHSLAELPDLATMLSMSGLEFMQAVQDGRLPAAPIAITLGFDLVEVADGRVVFRGAPGFAAMNPMGTVHGGWYGTLLDSAMACAVMTRVPRGRLYTTLEYKVNILRPIPPGTACDAIGVAVHVGRSTGIAEGRIVGCADGRLYATGSTTCIVMDPPPGAAGAQTPQADKT